MPKHLLSLFLLLPLTFAAVATPAIAQSDPLVTLTGEVTRDHRPPPPRWRAGKVIGRVEGPRAAIASNRLRLAPRA